MRVALPWLGYACGDCALLQQRARDAVPSQLNTGYSINGGFAEYALGYARHVVRVPDGVDPAAAAPLTCAGVTTYKAVKVSGAAPRPRRGLRRRRPRSPRRPVRAHHRRLGGRRRHQRGAAETALELGAEHVVNAGEEDPVAAIQRLGGADAAISTAVDPIAFEQALRSLAPRRPLVCVGLPADNHMRLPIFETVLGGLDVRGSIVGTRHDLEEVFELHRRGLTRVEYAERRLDDVNSAIEQVLDGSAPTPRLVFRMPSADLAAPDGHMHSAVTV